MSCSLGPTWGQGVFHPRDPCTTLVWVGMSWGWFPQCRLLLWSPDTHKGLCWPGDKLVARTYFSSAWRHDSWVCKSHALAVPFVSPVLVTMRHPHNWVTGSIKECLRDIPVLVPPLYTQKAGFLGWIENTCRCFVSLDFKLQFMLMFWSLMEIWNPTRHKSASLGPLNLFVVLSFT